MKREMLFRAKRIDNGEWVEGSLCTTLIPLIPERLEPIYILNDDGCYDVDPKTVKMKTDNGEWKNIKEVKIG